MAQEVKNVEFTKEFFPNDKKGLNEARDNLEMGKKEFNDGNIEEALSLLQKAQEYNPDNAELNCKIAMCYALIGNRDVAISYFEKTLAIAKSDATGNLLPFQIESYYRLGNFAYYQYEFDRAIDFFEKEKSVLTSQHDNYLAVVEKKLRECNTAKELMANPVRVFIDNLGETINTKYPEYSPVINADGSAIFYTACRPDGIGGEKAKSKNGIYNEDIFVIYRQENGEWTAPKNAGTPLNTPNNDAVVGISGDGATLYTFMAENGGDVGFAELNGNEWGTKKNMGKNINSPAHESSGTLSSDGKTFYFVSSRDDSDGSHDIYFSTKDEKGKWLPAENIGEPINSPYDEMSVFIHPNGTSLYFSSNGHNTMGGYDIFRSDFVDGKWTAPKNVGYPINTIDDDVFFSITASERYGYFSSAREGGFGGHDLYQITFLGEEKAPIYTSEDRLIAYLQKSQNIVTMEKQVKTSVAVTLLKGTVLDAKTQTPLLATIELTDNELGENIATFTTNSATGRYLVSLPSGKNYGITIKAEGYLFYSENIDIQNVEDAEYQEISKDVVLNKLEVGVKVVLRNIFFDTNKSTLTKQSIVELERLVTLLKKTKKLRIEISGHTDNVGSEQINKRLSEARAKSVEKYLESKGIDAKRLVSIGYGFDQPIESNDTEAGRAANRRTEFKILEN
ncbi:hypothetical protein FACS189452_05690 [Bacteroidia bacterium]|nr:hypothetical protein FACS189452_05690 [Bacteroidia bacterium]GHT81825.1 hypothetical protein FACS189467_6470 [Bacteroidia bacterium]